MIYYQLLRLRHRRNTLKILYTRPTLVFYRFVLHFWGPFVRIIYKLCGVGVNNVPRRGPFVVCANHSHLLDPFFIGKLIGRPVFQIASDEVFRKPVLRWFMWEMGAFPRQKGSAAVGALRHAMDLVRKGFPLVIYPEGGRNWDGETLPSIEATARLVKRLGVPLVTVVSKGNYIAWPRWAENRRKSRIYLHFSKPVTFDRSTPDEVICAHIAKGIYNNDNYTEVEKIKGRDPAKGLHRLLWRCPGCRSIDVLEERDGNRVCCVRCSREWEVDLRCRMREKGSSEWRAIKEYSDLMFREDEILPIPGGACPGLEPGEKLFLESKRVTLYHEPVYPALNKVGDGKLLLTDRKLVFVPEGGGDATSIEFRRILGRSTEKSDFFQVVFAKEKDDMDAGTDIARFEMHEESCLKWQLIYDYVRRASGRSARKG